MYRYTLGRGFAATVIEGGWPYRSTGVDDDVEELIPGDHEVTADGKTRVPIYIREDGGVNIKHSQIVGDNRRVIVHIGGRVLRGDDVLHGEPPESVVRIIRNSIDY